MPCLRTRAVEEYALEKQAVGFYRVLCFSETKNASAARPNIRPGDYWSREDAALFKGANIDYFKGVNIDHAYEMIAFKAYCPECAAVQPWSGIPCKGKQDRRFGLWGVGFIMTSIAALYTIWMLPWGASCFSACWPLCSASGYAEKADG